MITNEESGFVEQEIGRAISVEATSCTAEIASGNFRQLRNNQELASRTDQSRERGNHHRDVGGQGNVGANAGNTPLDGRVDLWRKTSDSWVCKPEDQGHRSCVLGRVGTKPQRE